MSTQVVNIHVFGRTLKLSCPIDEVEALNSAAEDLDNRLTQLREKTQIINSDHLIITAALNISYELVKEKQNNNKLDSEFRERLKKLQQLLDNALNLDK